MERMPTVHLGSRATSWDARGFRCLAPQGWGTRRSIHTSRWSLTGKG